MSMKQIFDVLPAQNLPVDDEVVFEHSLRTYVSTVLQEEAELVDAGKSPLRYDRSGSVKRLSLVDPDAGPADKHDTYFSQQEKWRIRSKSGRKLKNRVLDETIPGAEPGTVAFLDYHGDDTYVYIDYMKSRGDTRGRGYARILIDELIKRHPNLATLQFGHVMHPAIGKIMDELKQSLTGRISVVGYRDY